MSYKFKNNPKYFLALGSFFILVSGLYSSFGSFSGVNAETTKNQAQAEKKTSKTKQIAIFAGGCFWCVESDFDKVPGVLSTISGYTGGHTKNPTYKEVSYKETGHYEALKVTFDPSVVTYKQLVHIFWRTVDPTDPNGQFCDKGSSYRTAIFPVNDEQMSIAKQSKQEEQTNGKLKGRIVTKILKAKQFYDAEGYHQNYHQLNKIRYNYYRYGCGRDKRVKALWGQEAFKGLNGK